MFLLLLYMCTMPVETPQQKAQLILLGYSIQIIMQQKKVVIISGYMDIMHNGHLEYAIEAKELAGPDGIVVCIINSDHQAGLKKGYSFVPEKDRLAIAGAIRYVDKAVLSIDKDRTVCKTIRMLYDTEEFKPTHFFNAGDVTPEKPAPEAITCAELGIEMCYGNGPKIQSSSWIIGNSVKIAYEKMFM